MNFHPLHLIRRHSLFLLVILALLIMPVMSGLLTLFFTDRQLESQLREAIERRDHTIATELAPVFAQYYIEHREWTGAAKSIKPFELTWLVGKDLFSLAVDSQRLDFLIVDTRGTILAQHGRNYAETQLPDWLQSVYPNLHLRTDRPVIIDHQGDVSRVIDVTHGVPIVIDGQIQAFLFVRSMAQLIFNENEQIFLQQLRQSTTLAIALNLLVSLFLGGLILRSISHPLRQMVTASQRIAQGDFDVQLKIKRADEIGMLSSSFDTMASALKQSEQTREKLVAAVLHDLRTPVSLLLGNLEMMLDGMYQIDRSRISMLYEETRHLAGLMNNLDTLKQVTSSQSTPVLTRIDLTRMIQELTMEFEALFAKSDLSLTRSLPSRELPVTADPKRLREAFHSILNNAIKYLGTSSRLAVVLETDDNKVRVIFRDDGPGVPETSLPHLFERFYRVEPSRNRKTGGNGLGLAITREIIESLGGRTWAANLDPHGLEIGIELPLS